jgi:tRNA threonylcarbamoyladenosine modification (KEOPS) complex  Pcc1 subunit
MRMVLAGCWFPERSEVHVFVDDGQLVLMVNEEDGGEMRFTEREWVAIVEFSREWVEKDEEGK